MKIYEYKLTLAINYFFGLSTVISGMFLLIQIQIVPTISPTDITALIIKNASEAAVFGFVPTNAPYLAQIM